MAAAQKNKTFYSHYSALIRSFRGHLSEAHRLGEETIHDLRVDVKNLRALLDLLEKITKEEFKKKAFFDLLAPLFEDAGRLRAAAINLGLLRKLKDPASAPYRRFLQEEQKKTGMQFLRTLKAFDASVLDAQHAEAGAAAKRSTNEKVIARAEKEIAKNYKTVKRAAGGKRKKQLHAIRKRLKIVKALSKLLEALEKKKKWKRRLEQIKKTETLIGDWHDTDALIAEIKKFMKRHAALTGVRKMKPFVKRLEEKNERRVTPIFKALKKTLPA